MKNKIILGLMTISLLSTLSCGKTVDSVVKQVGKDMGEKLECGVSDLGAQVESDFAQDYDVKLYKSTVEKVLADLRVVKYLDPKDFWAFLSDETRDLLNYELNLIVLKNKISNQSSVYQSTAYFFTAVRDLFQDGTDYKLKDTNNTLFSFSVRGLRSTRKVLVNTKCGKFQKTDLSVITISDVILKSHEVQEVYECRSKDKSFVIMEGKDVLYLQGNKKISHANGRFYKKEIKKRFVNLSYESRDVSFKIKIIKPREEIVGDFVGQKARIEFKSADLAIDGDGACNSMKGTLEI
jgi:hypothetical protein